MRQSRSQPPPGSGTGGRVRERTRDPGPEHGPDREPDRGPDRTAAGRGRGGRLLAGAARHRRWGTVAARVVLGGVWLYAGLSKIGDLPASVRAVNAYEILPRGLAEFVGAALPYAEVTLGLLLLAGLGIRFGGIVSAMLLTAFVIGISAAWIRGLQIDCGCFGGGGELAAGESPSYGPELARDAALAVVAVLLATWPASRLSVDARLGTDTPVPARGLRVMGVGQPRPGGTK